MVMPGESDRTRKPPTRGVGSSVLAQTTIQRRPTAPVEKIFRPVSDQPPGTRRAVVAGSPPRAGVPSSGSTRSALIRTGRDPDSATTSAYSAAGHVSCRACAACCSRVIARDQGDRRVAAAQRVQDGDGLGQARAGTAVALGDGRRQQPGRVHGLDPGGGEGPGPVVGLGALRPARPSPRAGSQDRAPGRSCGQGRRVEAGRFGDVLGPHHADDLDGHCRCSSGPVWRGDPDRRRRSLRLVNPSKSLLLWNLVYADLDLLGTHGFTVLTGGRCQLSSRTRPGPLGQKSRSSRRRVGRPGPARYRPGTGTRCAWPSGPGSSRCQLAIKPSDIV